MKPPYSRPLTRKELAEMPDEDIDFSDIPELDERFWKNAVLRTPPAKQPISIRLDQHVLDYFRSQGAGYQTQINSVLRMYVEAQRRVARSSKANALHEPSAEPGSFKRPARKADQASAKRKPKARKP